MQYMLFLMEAWGKSLWSQDFRGMGPQAGDPDLHAHCLMRFDKVSDCFTGTVGSKIAVCRYRSAKSGVLYLGRLRLIKPVFSRWQSKRRSWMCRLEALLTLEHETFCTDQLFQKAFQWKKISLVLNDLTGMMHSTRNRILLTFYWEEFCCLEFLQRGKEDENNSYRECMLHKLACFRSCFSFLLFFRKNSNLQ